MWARFGSPTPAAESGTAEEFDRAMERHQAGEPIRVSFLFCTADVPMAKLDAVQFGKVQEFKSRAQSRGCLTRDFVDDASLINSINLILDRFANTWESQESNHEFSDYNNIEKGISPNTLLVEPHHESDSDNKCSEDEDIGILDAVDDFNDHNASFLGSGPIDLRRWL